MRTHWRVSGQIEAFQIQFQDESSKIINTTLIVLHDGIGHFGMFKNTTLTDWSEKLRTNNFNQNTGG